MTECDALPRPLTSAWERHNSVSALGVEFEHDFARPEPWASYAGCWHPVAGGTETCET